MALINSLPGAITQGLIWGIMAIGLFITYKVLNFSDLTVDGSLCTGACVCVVLLINGVNIWICTLVAFLAGALTGLITGVFHTAMGIPPILSGILTQLILWSLNLKILGRSSQAVPSRQYDTIITQLNIPSALIISLLFCAAIIGLLYFFFGTEFGCSLRATGDNEMMSNAQGINVKFCKVFGLMLANGLVALSGALLAQYQGSVDINMGRGAIVIGLAAIIIGETIVSKISKNFAVQLTGAALGGVAYYLVYTIVIVLGLDTDLLKMLSALVVAIFLAVPYWKNHYLKGKKLGKGKNQDA